MNLLALFGVLSAEKKRSKLTQELERLREQQRTGKPSAINVRDAFLTPEQITERIAVLEHKLGITS
jgi:hypothetical protein